MGSVPLYYLRYLVFTNSIRDAKANTLRCGKSETEFVRVAQHTTFWYAHPTTTTIFILKMKQKFKSIMINLTSRIITFT